MPFITVDQENSAPVQLYYEDQGSGDPIILIHGWPLNGASWEKQTMALLDAGYRVITYDRRGFGQSSKPAFGYDYDTFASDLHQIISKLDLKNVSLVGFSMGSAELARYMGKYGTKNLNKAVFMSVIPPFLLEPGQGGAPIDKKVFEGIKDSLMKDRPDFMWQFLNNFYNYDELEGKRISEKALQASWSVGIQSSFMAAWTCVDSWQEDFRKDLVKVDIPTLIIHGNADRILPIESSARPLSKILKNTKLVELEGGPHGILLTHAEECCRELVQFFEPAEKTKAQAQKRSETQAPPLQ